MYDVVIVGSGPAGLSAAVYARRAKLKTLVIEKAGYSGGQIVNTSDVDNYLGLQGIEGFEMAMKFRTHAEHFEAEFLDDEVVSIQDKEDGTYDIVLKSDKDISTKTIILATGASYDKLHVPGEAEYTGRGVSYCATCDGAFYKGKIAAVVGGGDVALEDALYLSNMADKVYLIHRRDELRGAKVLQDKVFAADNIMFMPDTVVSSINGSDGLVSSIDTKNVKTNMEENISVNGIFIAVGMKPNVSYINELVELDKAGYVVASEDGITSKKGIFVAGDMRTKVLRQVITAVSDGANAVASVEKYLREQN
ncbi:MAG: FAD-dependent oxidoreductase [Lachnospiraceae bacterium]|nr:FAD-dependent oxidoreductase [Lachnospiraceae bacterium]MEE0862331.1 FAD-dependent oxidoreductase [Lachnospiraceae bacterium]